MIALDAALRKLTVCQLTHESRGNGGDLRPRVLCLRAAAGGSWTRMESYNWKAKPISPCLGALVGEKPLFLRRAPLLAFRAMTTANTADTNSWRGAIRTAVMSGVGLQTRPRARAKYTGIVLPKTWAGGGLAGNGSSLGPRVPTS